MAVVADPKAIAARRASSDKSQNNADVRKQKLQTKKRSVDQGKANQWRRDHGLTD